MAGPGQATATSRLVNQLRLKKQALAGCSQPVDPYFNRRHNSLQDESEDDLDPSHVLASKGQQVCTKEQCIPTKKRGRTRGIRRAKKRKDGAVDEIEIPEELQRIVGKNAQDLITEAGIVIRKRAPLQVAKWKEIDEASKETLWTVRDKFGLEDCLEVRRVVNAQLNKLYRNWRHRLHKEHFQPHRSRQAALKDKHPDVSPEDWAWLCEFFTKDKFIAMSARNKKSRGEQTISHSTGTKSYARICCEEKIKNNGVEIGDIALWKVTHYNETKGTWKSTHAKDLYEQMLELQEKALSEDSPRTDEDICLEVLGFKSGYIRGRGPGPKRNKMSSTYVNRAEVESATRRADEAEQRNRVMAAELQELKAKQQETDAFLRAVSTAMNMQGFTLSSSPPSG